MKYGGAMNKNNMIDRQRYWKIQGDVERVIEVSRLHVEHFSGDNEYGDS